MIQLITFLYFKDFIMLIDDNILYKLEKLSYLKIDEDKRELVKKQLESIIDFLETLDNLSLHDDKITNILKQKCPLREDKASSNKEVIEIILKNAPAKNEHFFLVPKILD